MEIKINKDKNNTYKIDVTVEKDRVTKHLDEALMHEAGHLAIKGFRKGKAPLNVIKEHVDPAKLRSHALNHIVDEVQKQVLTENKFAPIVYPRYEIKEFAEGKDLLLTMIIVEKPDIEIGDYKKAVKDKKTEKEKAAAKVNKEKKDTPPSTEEKPEETQPEMDSELTTEDVIDAVLSVSKIGVSEQLINEETDRMMQTMLNQLDQMGIPLDKYLEAVKKTADEVRAEYIKLAEKNIASDFALSEIAKKENVEATDADVAATIAAIPEEKSREALSKPEQRMYIKSVLLKNKLIQKLADAAVGQEKKSDSSDKKE